MLHLDGLIITLEIFYLIKLDIKQNLTNLRLSDK